MSALPLLFAFEIPSCEDFAYIPLGVRFHLDRCGLRLSLAQWQRLPYQDRVALASVPVPDSDGGAMSTFDSVDTPFATAMKALEAHYFPGEIERVAPQAVLPGDALDGVPEEIVAQCRHAGVPPLDLAAWQTLDRFQRYALAKLSRKPKANHDFVPALQEFGLLRRAS